MSRRDQERENLRRFYIGLEQSFDDYLTWIEINKKNDEMFARKFLKENKQTVTHFDGKKTAPIEEKAESSETKKSLLIIDQFRARFSAVVAEAKTQAQRTLNQTLEEKQIPKNSPTAQHAQAILDHTLSTDGIIHDAIHLRAQGKNKPSKDQYHEAMHEYIDELHGQYEKVDTHENSLQLIVALRYASAMKMHVAHNNHDNHELEFHLDVLGRYTPAFNFIAKKGGSLFTGFENEIVNNNRYNPRRFFPLIDEIDKQGISAQDTPTNNRRIR